jgi:putative acetyltransferase
MNGALKPALRPFLPAEGPLLAQIFRDAIEGLTGEDYDEAQQAAWTAVADDEEEFVESLASALTIVATIEGAPAGFISVKGGDHIDKLYVHPSVARKGVGTTLCDAVERLAVARGATNLMVDASDTARPLFEKRGFTARYRQTIELGAEWLGNTHMEKPLADESKGQNR